MEDKQSIIRDRSVDRISIDTMFQAVIDHYKQDLREFFTRSNFYLAVETGLLSVFGVRDPPDSQIDYLVTAAIVAAGLALSLAWWVAGRGSLVWIDRWRKEVQCLSKGFSPTQSYHNIEKNAADKPWDSPERVTNLLPWLFGFVWFTFAVILLDSFVP